MKKKSVSKVKKEQNISDWKCRACDNSECVFSSACENLPLPENISTISPVLRKAFKLMRDYHHYSALRISHIAKACKISVRRLQLLFQKELHCTFSKCLRCLRAAHAQRIKQKYPHITVKEIKKKVGLASYHGLYLARQELERNLNQYNVESP